MTYGILVLIDSLLLTYAIITFVLVIGLGSDCYVNENKDYPYTQEMVDHPKDYDYVSDPVPQNVHNHVRTVLIIFIVAFTINLMSDAAKICIKIDTGFKRKVANTLKVTHILTLGALIFGTWFRYSRDG